MAMARSFASTDRFIAEVSAGKLKPAYVLVGDEAFFRDRCRAALLQHLVPPELREFSLYDIDLAETSVAELLDRARTPSLMAPIQIFFVRGVKALYGRGSHKQDFAAIESYCKDANPDAVIIFIADFISIPADVRRMDLQDRDKYERVRETLGEFCTLIELARVEEGDGVRWILETASEHGMRAEPEAARELVDALGADMTMIANELEKLMLYVAQKKRITLGDVETMVVAAKQRNLYELTDAISMKDRARALQVLSAMLSTGDGEEAAIGYLHMLARTLRQMLVIVEKNVRDSRTIWQALWQGFRLPPFAAEDVIRQARRYKNRRELTRALRLIARADLELRSSPVSKRLVLERLLLDLTAEAKVVVPLWQQDELPV